MSERSKTNTGIARENILYTIMAQLIVYAHGRRLCSNLGVDYVVIGFDMEVQPLVTHNVA